MTAEDKSLEQQLQEFVETAKESSPGAPGRDPVNRTMIHHWCDAVGDNDPIYLDEELAAQSIHGGIVAPPTMLQAWSMPGLAGRGPSLPEQPLDREAAARSAGPIELLHEHGYTSVVATNCEQEYKRYLRPGDALRTGGSLESISSEKKTALGDGYFVTNRTTYWDQHDEVVAEMRFRIFWFKPRQPEKP
jgi:acyl dehydratase